MKKLLLPLISLGLPLLAGCASSVPQDATFDLRVNLRGVPNAEVVIENLSVGETIFTGWLDAKLGKIIPSLKAGEVYRISGKTLEGFKVQGPQEVTLMGNQAVTLTYTTN